MVNMSESTALWTVKPGTKQLLTSLPLRSRKVSTRLHCDSKVASTCETMHYYVEDDTTLTFKFPIPPESAVYQFEATVGHRSLRMAVKPKDEAKKAFLEAVDGGHTAALMQEQQDSIYSIDLGNLGAHQECVVRISYLQLLSSFAGALEWTHTSTWVPPYLDAHTQAHSQLEHIRRSTPQVAAHVSYSIGYEVHVIASDAVLSISSSTHDVRVASCEAPPHLTYSKVELAEEVSDPAKDFKLLVELPLDIQPHSKLILQQSGCEDYGEPRRTMALVNFVVPSPGTAPEESGSPGPKEASGRACASKKELILVLDNSGSMDGLPIEYTKEAATYFIKDLPPNDHILFNVSVFSSTFTSLYATSQPYTQGSQAEAVQWVKHTLGCDMAGTEMYGVLSSIYGREVPEGTERHVIFLTDGGVGGKDRILRLVSPGSSPTADRTVIHCLGVGHGAHRALLDGMAEKTGGTVQYVLSDKEIVSKMNFLRRVSTAAGLMRKPQLLATACSLRMLPAFPPPCLYPGQVLQILAEVVESSRDAALTLSMERRDDAQLELRMPLGKVLHPAAVAGEGQWVQVGGDGASDSGLRWQQLEGVEVMWLPAGEALAVKHAMAYIRSLVAHAHHGHAQPDLEVVVQPGDMKELKAEVTRLGMAANLITPYTSAVGIIVNEDHMDTRKTVHVEVPLKAPYGRTLWNDSPGHGGDDEDGDNQDRRFVDRSCSTSGPRCRESGRTRRVQARPCSFTPFSALSDTVSAMSSTSSLHLSYGMGQARCAAAQWLSRDRAPQEDVCYAASPRVCHGAAPGGGTGPARKQEMERARVEESRKALMYDEMENSGNERDLDLSDELVNVRSAPRAAAHDSSADQASEVAGAAPINAVQLLNDARTFEGFWRAVDWSLLRSLIQSSDPKDTPERSQDKADKAVSAKPVELSADMWMTVLALAFLRKHHARDEQLWEDMASKAFRWLHGTWPGPGDRLIASKGGGSPSSELASGTPPSIFTEFGARSSVAAVVIKASFLV